MLIRNQVYKYDENGVWPKWTLRHDVHMYMTPEDWEREMKRLMIEFPDFQYMDTDLNTNEDEYCYSTVVNDEWLTSWYYVPKEC